MKMDKTEVLKIEHLEARVPVADYVKACVDVDRFLPFCKACDNYQKTWSCPPFSFDPIEYWNKYETFEIHANKIYVPDELREKRYEKEEIFKVLEQILVEAKKEFDESMHSIEREGVALSGGTCLICPSGSCKRLTGEPCIHPERMRYSIESLGGDVSKTVKLYLGEEMLWMKDGILPEYFILVGGVLR